ncbi:MAG: hypothetical protein HY748_11425 [Elusimicrobia bacterium]|nr:hypothetical protein [Elusimicrobiota bacterium]
MKARKGFDCLEFKRLAQTEIYDEIKALTPAQQIEYSTAKRPAARWADGGR